MAISVRGAAAATTPLGLSTLRRPTAVLPSRLATMHAPVSRLAFVSLLALGCSNEPALGFLPEDAGPAAATDAGDFDAGRINPNPPGVDVPPVVRPDSGGIVTDNVRVYANTADTLFAIDPRRLTVQRIADFGWPNDGRNHEMTDIAVNAQDQLWGITFNAIYRVETATARCTFVAPFEGTNFNGLSFLPGSELDGAEILVATNRTGGVFQVDTVTGATRLRGSYGGGLGSSGDIVSVEGAGTFATAVRGFNEEVLVRVDPTNGAARVLGVTGQGSTWGLAYWRQRLFGFTADGNFLTLDINTGAATVITNTGRPWWGAGVTTLAPTAPP